ncbi:MAG: glycosyltransferase family 4 protein [Bacteroidetes bacterium]|nr:glycosyltransferase family 4 protein [Bacteroidota bacterium]
MKLNNHTIYIFSDWYVPGFKAGGPIQSVYNLATLLSKTNNVKIITRNTDYGNTNAFQDIQSDEWITIAPQHNVLYLSAKNTSIKTIKSICLEAKNSPVIINGIFSFWFSILPLFYTNTYNCHKIIVAVRGMLHKSALSVKPIKKHIFLAFARGFGLYKKSTFLATSEIEKNEIEKILGKVNIKIAPNIPISTIDINEIESKSFKNSDNELRLLFLGRIAPEKNPLTVLQVLQVIKYPVSITFIGSSIDSNYQMQFEDGLKKLPSNVKHTWIKELPHQEITTIFKQTDVMVLPSLGENFGHAIFESFANAVPVIIGNNTPWRDIEQNNGGIEVKPNDIEVIFTAISLFNNMTNQSYKIWQLGALNIAQSYFEHTNFETAYTSILEN